MKAMLVLSRVVGELISIGDTISVRVVAINGGSVRFGVEAPQDVNVHRTEIYERIQRKVARKKKSIE
jgi:carbon storage regulator